MGDMMGGMGVSIYTHFLFLSYLHYIISHSKLTHKIKNREWEELAEEWVAWIWKRS